MKRYPRAFIVDCFICEGQGVVSYAESPSTGWAALQLLGWRRGPVGEVWCPTCTHRLRTLHVPPPGEQHPLDL